MTDVKQVISAFGNVPQYGPQRVSRLMKHLDMGVRSFAFVLNVNPATVRRWLVGASRPCNSARRMMQMLETVPGVLDALAYSAGTKTNIH